MSELVSVCIPTYNGAAFLAQCLDGVLAQTYADLEILVVDDASRDGTVGIAREYARRDSRVQVIENGANLGLVGNWNKCLGLARGLWVKFLFQDDLINPACVAHLVTRAQATGMPLVACDREFLYEAEVDEVTRDGYERHRRFVCQTMAGGVLTRQDLCALALRHVPRNFVGEPSVTLIDARVASQVGQFNADLIHLCDAEYWLRLGMVGGIAWIPKALASFRVHRGSTTSLNHSARQFRAMALDPLIIRHEYLFSPTYLPLREYASLTGQGRILARSFWESAHDCRQIAEARALEGDPVPMRDWQHLQQRYVQIGKVPRLEQLRRKARRALRALSSPFTVAQ